MNTRRRGILPVDALLSWGTEQSYIQKIECISKGSIDVYVGKKLTTKDKQIHCLRVQYDYVFDNNINRAYVWGVCVYHIY
jgi:hypothetical protein